jgi:hypothetical protein
MRKTLLVTTAMAALIGSTALAGAQTTAPEGNKAQAPAAGQHQAAPGGGGAMSHPQPSGGQARPSGAGAAPGGSAQTQSPQAAPQRSGEEQHNNAAPQRGTAQEEQRGTEQRGTAQEQQRGAQEHENTAPGQQKSATGRASGGTSVQLSQDQRSKIKDVIVRGHDVARVDNVNFNITVGTAVPRSVHFVVLPEDVVTLVPEYRGFDYIVVGDQLLIIDPDSLEIVAILPV